MVSSRKADPEKAAKYAIAASKGFSYYLPKTAQRHLRDLLKQLPSAARSIYNEYYRDLMCAKACAPESAVAMTKFVTSSFSKIARKHNAFAREMNKEINSNEHEGYEPVKFPIVAEQDMEEEVEEVTTVVNTGKKRKRASAVFAPLPSPKAASQKKVKTKSTTQRRKSSAVAMTTTTPPPSSPGRHSYSPSSTISDDAERDESTANSSVAEDIQRLTPESDKSAEDNRVTSSQHRHVDWCSQTSSPLSDVPSGAELSDEDEPAEEPAIRYDADQEPSLPLSTVSVKEDGEARSSLPHPSTPPSRSVDDDMMDVVDTDNAELGTLFGAETQGESTVAPTAIITAMSSEDPANGAIGEWSPLPKDPQTSLGSNVHSDVSFESDYVLKSEEELWEDGIQALEDFDWGRDGSRWLAGRGLVSIHYEDVGPSAGLFRSNRQDDGGADRMFPGVDEDMILYREKHVVDLTKGAS